MQADNITDFINWQGREVVIYQHIAAMKDTAPISSGLRQLTYLYQIQFNSTEATI
jgi:hypothetical protein